MESNKLGPYFNALTSAKTDNEKFAALLMVAKVGSGSDDETKLQILEAVGSQFLLRLMKTKKVPEGCSPYMYKSVAVSVMSALCSCPQVAESPALLESVPILNSILTSNPGDQSLVDDCYECLGAVSQTTKGMEAIFTCKTVSVFCEVITEQFHGSSKAADILWYILHMVGHQAWQGCEEDINKLLSYIAKEFEEEKNVRKFALCKTLGLILSTVPFGMKKSPTPRWLKHVVNGLGDIFKSKLGGEQREPALRLASVLMETQGVQCLLPPHSEDCKLFLLIVHLCCVEIRMVLEDQEREKVFEAGPLLSSCYTLLENVIHHITNNSPIPLDDKQFIQLHSAMVGAFGAVIYFLNHIAQDRRMMLHSVVLATVRVLSAWLAEETAALKEEVYQLLPFLITLSKLCSEAGEEIVSTVDKKREGKVTHRTESYDQNKTSVLQSSHSPVCDTKNPAIIDSAGAGGEACQEQALHCEKLDDLTLNDLQEQHVENSQACVSKTNQDLDPRTERHVRFSKPCGETEICDTNTTTRETTTHPNQCDKTVQSEKFATKTKAISGQLANYESSMEVYCDKHVTEPKCKEPQVKVDILRLLLPGLCHLTTEDEARKILMAEELHVFLCQYFQRKCVEFQKSEEEKETAEIQTTLTILCNIFLNYTVLEPGLVAEDIIFHSVFESVCSLCAVTDSDESHIVLWGNSVTLGLMILQHRAQKKDDVHVHQFFGSCIRFLSGPFVPSREMKAFHLKVSDLYLPAWDEIAPTWFLSMQAVCACIAQYPQLTGLILRSGWLPTVTKILLECKEIEEETKTCMLSVLIATAKADNSAKQVIREKGGDQIARLHNSGELSAALREVRSAR